MEVDFRTEHYIYRSLQKKFEDRIYNTQKIHNSAVNVYLNGGQCVTHSIDIHNLY